MLTDKQIAVRKRGLFGTDASAIEGTNPYYDATMCWGVKTGRISEVVEQNNAMRIGHILEPHIRSEFYPEITGNRVRASHKTLWHPDCPFIGAHIDGKVVGKRIGVEFKTCGLRAEPSWGKPWTDEIPPNYRSQIKHYALVTGLIDWHVACWFKAKDELRVYKVSFNEAELSDLLELEAAFWGMVRSDTPPPVNHTKSCRKAYRRIYPVAMTGESKVATRSAKRHVSQYHKLGNKIEDLQAKRDLAKNNLIAELGECELLVDEEDRVLVTSSNDTNNTRRYVIKKEN